jgi:hypothetical protein
MTFRTPRVNTPDGAPKKPIQGQARCRRVDLTAYCVRKRRCLALAIVDGPLHQLSNSRIEKSTVDGHIAVASNG